MAEIFIGMAAGLFMGAAGMWCVFYILHLRGCWRWIPSGLRDKDSDARVGGG